MATWSLKDKAYHILREKLITCEYAPGSILNESQLAEELGISRTPVRESLSQLENDGYINILPKKGILVTEITVNDAMQIFQTRLEIEPIAVRLAGPHLPEDELRGFYEKFSGPEPDLENGLRLDTAMHLFIIEHCGNRYIIDLMQRVFADNTRVVIATKQNEVKIHDAREEHRAVLSLLLEKKYDEATTEMRTHVESCRRAAMDFFFLPQSRVLPEAPVYKMELEKMRRSE